GSLCFPLVVFFVSFRRIRYLYSFPTRRSSDLIGQRWMRGEIIFRRHDRRTTERRVVRTVRSRRRQRWCWVHGRCGRRPHPAPPADRKSTRLNSSHVKISYAVFCLKKKIEQAGR